jgi:tetratricopeptide (TPR) repeat protein
MKRKEAIARIRKAGGRYIERLSRSAEMLVVGQAEWPLRRNGRPTGNLLRARRYQQEGREIQVVAEIEFLQILGLRHLIDDLQRLYTTSQLQRMLSISESQLRSWVRMGLIEPARVSRRLKWYDLRGVMLARALHRLTDSGVKTAAIKRSLVDMSRWLPDAGRMLVLLEAADAEDRLRVRLPDGRMAEPDGQFLFEFAERGASAGNGGAHTPPDSNKPLPDEFQLSDPEAADRWFAAGIIAEEKRELDEAAEAYGRSLLAGGPVAETCFNLAGVLRRMGRRAEAVQRYLQAVEIDPEYVEAWYNLGCVLERLGRMEEAVRAYVTALKFEESYADARWNLAWALEKLGRVSEAREAWQAYLLQDSDSRSSEHVRRHLIELDSS